MIVTRTPFRIPLGGGSTDLPAYYERHGGFIFSAGINLYMYVSINRPPIDDLIRVNHESEIVETLKDLKHNLARGALTRHGIQRMIEIASKADVPDGTGMGSSGSYLIGLLTALYALKGKKEEPQKLAEEAFSIATDDLLLPDGKQDFYAAAFGDFTALEIARNGTVSVTRPLISLAARTRFEKQSLLFYTGVTRSSADLLHEQQRRIRQHEKRAIELKHETKRIGHSILSAFETNDLDQFGTLMNEHWNIKREMSQKMSNDLFDDLYTRAKRSGALGGKILGAGGGGFFLIYCLEGAKNGVREIFREAQMREIPFSVGNCGSEVIYNETR